MSATDASAGSPESTRKAADDPGAAGLRDRIASADAYRVGALAGVVALTAAYASVLYHVTDVVGAVAPFATVVIGAIALATAFGRTLRLRSALVVTAALLIGGLAAYLLSIPQSQFETLSVGLLLSDTIALLSGLSVLRLTAAGTWATSVAPGPVFLSWYLAIRRRYALSVAAGGAALLLFVLTGDANTVTTLVGVGGAVAAVGLGTMEKRGGSTAQIDTLTMLVAAMVVLSMTVSIVPGGATRPLVGGGETIESGVVNADDSVEVVGSIQLSPSVRFSVRSDERQYWQTGAYDRYTGSGWVRTGDAVAYADAGQRPGPPGDSRPLVQAITAETEMSVLPAAWKPVSVSDDVSGRTMVTQQGALILDGSVDEGTEYAVTSRVPEYTTADLREAGTDYPAAIEERYLQLPESTSDRVRERAAEIAGDAETPYAKAEAVEQWLESNKQYSLTVREPDGDVADEFLFEMESGYCVYYATTMATLLRAEGVPARFVTGYTTGQEVGDGEYVVRGLDSHAWVEVYFPDVGWVRFDPTPAGPRRTAERVRLDQARENNVSGVDTEDTEPTPTPTPTPTPVGGDPAVEDAGRQAGSESSPGNVSGPRTPDIPRGVGRLGRTPTGDEIVGETGGEGPGGLPLPSRRTLGLGLVAFVGLAAGAHRSGTTRRLYDALRAVHQRPSDDPRRDVERAFERLEYLLGRQYRPRRPGETPRAYVEALSSRGLLSSRGIDQRAVDVARTYERAHYGNGVDREEATEAIEKVNELARERTPVVRQFAG